VGLISVSSFDKILSLNLLQVQFVVQGRYTSVDGSTNCATEHREAPYKLNSRHSSSEEEEWQRFGQLPEDYNRWGVKEQLKNVSFESICGNKSDTGVCVVVKCLFRD
jgi:hypothetical protein